ncbi:Uncharacterized conserved protein, DUF952 family [Paenibacillus uliginis N3/975]|uniref:Uncharacterized conserved protein, DUF952 family n=1 Tax=Paenibacillus uliginis N3/975 TaxID=1313296 RepID=A0A1X7HAV6_9BACL|nr:DUF952 domain-containing protein [Paenibacillus uliginis]SMF83024.1 Uncharacterized conserved protein, DUF952 family [Paenibacillus uliginis N3/975]
MIMHILSYPAWRQTLQDGEYAPASLEKEGFIHCSKPDQVVDVANSIYKGQTGLFLMFIDEEKVESNIVYEDLYELGKLFPHIYGPLNLDAVTQIVEFIPDEDGNFTLPTGVLQ